VSTISQYFRKLYSSKVLIPVSNIRKQGFSSETLALSISIGIIGGAFPVLGIASYICLIMTLSFRQNFIIVQLVNWLVYPLQILLLIPFMKLGNSILTGSDLTITIHQVVVAFQSGLLNGIKLIGIISLYGVIAWAVIAIPTMFILYSLFLLLFRNIKRIKLKSSMVVVCNSKKRNAHIQHVIPTLILETLPIKNNG
jgi:uncharacterized protein (DUF2062 family)